MSITVDVVYALADKQVLRSVKLVPPASVADAIAASGLNAEFPAIDLTKNKVGIFGQRSTMDTQLQDGDRVEIYRPLNADPMESRRRRAEHARRAKR
mgnify:CR=1 FL=1